MATPVLQLQGAVSAVTTGNLTVTIPTGEVAGDILVVTTVAWVVNTTTGANTIAAPSGWNKFTPDTTTITGSLIDAEYSFFWRRATSNAEANPTFVRPTGWDTGTDTNWSGRCYVIRGCIPSGDPWTQIVASTVSTAANPAIPAVNVTNTGDLEQNDLPIAFMVKTDNTTTPTGSDIGSVTWTGQTEGSTTTGTDAAFRAYTVDFYSGVSSVSGPTMTGGTAPAQGGSVYFVASFKSPIVRTAGGIGYSAISAQPYFVDSGFTNTSTTFLAGQTFVADGKVLDSARVFIRENGTAGTTVLRAEIYALSGTLDGGTPTGSALATSSNVTASLTGGVNYTTFSFTGANRITLTDGVNYALVVRLISGANGWFLYRNNETSRIAGGYLQSSNNGSSWGNFGTAIELIYGIYGADAIGSRVQNKTATGSGLGTESATGNRVALTFDRTATGLGTGSQSVVGLHIAPRTAEGVGTSDQSADDQLVHVETATGSGIGTSSSSENIIIGIRTYERTATGSGVGAGEADVDLIHTRNASGSGLGTELTIATHIHDRSAVGGGFASQATSISVLPLRIATGSGLGSSTANGLRLTVRNGYWGILNAIN